MPIISYTGLPGHGKTSLMVEHLLREAKKTDDRRDLWAAGIDGLQPGLAELLKDPKQWNAVRPGETCTCHDTENSEACNSHVIPNGSLIFVDEAWKWFGHLHSASRTANPPHVLELAEHRHRGIDFVWTFQQPSQIYPFARGLMGEHYHVVRRFGTRMIDVFKWEELNEDVKSVAKREAAQRTTRAIPTDAHDHYKSAEVHTIKAKIPWKVILLPVMVVAALGLGWLAYDMLRPDNMGDTLGIGSTASGVAAAGDAANGSAPAAKVKSWETAADYARDHLPRFPGAPWTAPIFDQRGATADPKLYCMSSERGEDGQGGVAESSCTCHTEQGTQYLIPFIECQRFARRGPVYNPYQERGESDGQGAQVAQQPQPGRPAGDAGSVVSSSATRTEIFPRSEGYQPGGG